MLEEILVKFSNLNSAKVRVKQTEKNDLRVEERVIEDIRMIKPQSRGSVVASGGNPLPISRSKKLNLQNTPVILVRDRKKPVYVFPCKIGERYYSIIDGISFLKENLPNLAELEGEMEDALVTIISDAPEKLEEGLVLEDLELDTPTGKTDMVFRDQGGQFLVVEVEREAADSAVGQILATFRWVLKNTETFQRILCAQASSAIGSIRTCLQPASERISKFGNTIRKLEDSLSCHDGGIG